jgi:protein TonB
MAEHENDAPHRVHNPFDAPAPKNGGGFMVGLALALALNAGLIFWVAKSRFEIKEKLFEDEKLDTQLIKPPPPPPQQKEKLKSRKSNRQVKMRKKP